MSEPLGLAGEPVTVSGMGDLAVGHGRFRVDNPGSAPLRAAVDGLWLEVGGATRPLEVATVFDADRDQALDPSSFEVPAGTTTFLLGFAPVPNPGDDLAVGLRLSAGDATVEARSPVVLQRRISPDR